MAFDKNNICKDLAWKVPFENYEFLTPEFYAEKNLEILYKDYVYDKRKKIYLIDKECDNPIVLEADNFNDFSSIPMMFKDLPLASTDAEFDNEGFLVYGYKNIDERSYFDTEDPAYDNALDIMIKALFYIKNIIFEFFNEKCIFKLTQEGCSDKVHESCCGFTAPIFACILNQYLLHYSKYEPLEADKLILIDMAKSYYKAISGYERSPTGVGTKCKGFSDNNFSENGVYLVAFYDRNDVGFDDCRTFHHFIVYIHNEFCILIDSWSGKKGSREEWLRIMKTSDMKRVLKYIGSTDNLSSLNEWLNIFFCIPHGNNGSDPATASYYDDSFYEETTLYSVGAIFLGHNKPGYWYKHAGRQRLPTKEWSDYVKAEELKIRSSSSPKENIFENPYERRKTRLTRKNKRINKFGWKTGEWKGKTSKNGGRKRI